MPSRALLGDLKSLTDRTSSGTERRQAVARLMKCHASATVLDPKRYAGDSLPAGLATSAAAAGAGERSIMAQTPTHQLPMVRRYIGKGRAHSPPTLQQKCFDASMQFR